MPRPGPRPYECVRRAWHSDRHQPLRGSLIQQIFRLVHESHSSVTKKNKEWQEKLPIVVLKAEEIMYSKANSESEYMDLETLWQRVNDAVDTIIRRDESTETGDLLPPCVEAALHLGCVPVRASRSQRCNNHRSYLGPRALESANPTSSPPTTWDKTTAERCPQLLPFHLSNRPKFARENVGNRAVLVSEPNSHQFKTDNVVAPDNHSCLHKKNPLGHDQMTAKETSTALSIGSVYPLYYGALYHDNESQFGPQILERTNSDGIFVGNPISMSVPESTRMGVVRNLFTFGSARQPEIASKGTTQRNIHNKNDLPEKECDLSLRLGLFLDPSTNVESAGVGSASYRKGWKYSGLSSDMEKEFCFSSGNTANEPINSCLAKRLREDEAYKEPTVRKQKTPFSSIFEDGQFSWQPELLPYQFTGHMKGPGF